jgi:hypothetical protein
VKAVDEFEAERDQERDKEQEVGQIVRDLGAGGVDVDIDAIGDEQQRRGNHPHVNDAGQWVKAAIKVGSLVQRGLDRTGQSNIAHGIISPLSQWPDFAWCT